MQDRLKKIWEDQRAFMKLLQEKRNFPQYPVNIATKNGQRLIKEVTQEAQYELFEALQHLKNTKNHRVTEIADVDLDEFVEENVDAVKYIIEGLLLAGVTLEQFFEVYEKKTLKNTKRINEGY